MSARSAVAVKRWREQSPNVAKSQATETWVCRSLEDCSVIEMVEDLLSPDVRKCFDGFNFDLLYGLPRQTRETFENTVDLVNLAIHLG